MTITQFIEKAVDGGWQADDETTTATMLLDPLAWQAVGKVEGWPKLWDCNAYIPGWQSKMVGLMYSLIEGVTIESYLETL